MAASSPLTVAALFEEAREDLNLELVAGEAGLDRVIPEEAINRPGLALAGFYQYFAHRRIQVLGLAENSYLRSLEPEERRQRLAGLFGADVPLVILTRNRKPIQDLVDLAEAHRIPVMRTPLITSRFINLATVILENLTAPQTRVQGTMLDVMGVGVLLEGDPGIGKSETALALVERGHALVSDDVTVLRRDSLQGIVGSAVEVTRFHMEIRGLGIIHVPSLFGVASVRPAMRLDCIIRLERYHPKSEIEMSGFAPQTRDVLGLPVPLITLPVAPGRDMGHVVEVAALNQKLKALGHDAVKELDEKMMKLLLRHP